MPSINQLKAQLSEAIRVAEDLITAGAPRNDVEVACLKSERLHAELVRAKDDDRAQKIRMIGGIEYGGGGDLASALLEQGWDLKTQPRATVDNGYALRFKTGAVDGGVDGTEVVDRFLAPGLGLDGRYLYPHVRTQGVAPDDTGVQSYRQKSRSLASPSDMIRAIDATDSPAKPETDTTSEPVAAQLKQIATISSGTPNVLLANQSFRSWVNTDLVGAYRAAVDFHIVTEVAGAGIPAGGGGTNIFEDILYTQALIRDEGYDPSLVVLSPNDALSVQLLILSGGDEYVFTQTAPSIVVTPSVDDGAGFVCDPSALGILFLGPFTLQAFEENAGSTNSSTVRAESSGLYLVQRPTAAATLPTAS